MMYINYIKSCSYFPQPCEGLNVGPIPNCKNPLFPKIPPQFSHQDYLLTKFDWDWNSKKSMELKFNTNKT